MLMFILIAALCGLSFAISIPFSIEGALQSVTVSGTDFNAGGTMTVDGMSITVPKNTQVQFPAAFVSWPDTANVGLTGYEVSVAGNVVDGKPIAGLIQISQFLLGGGNGVISALANDGLITLTSGQKLRINDPNGVFSAGYTSKPLFTADDQNPSITAYSGFPMCVPRSDNDPKCPISNRPAGQTTFAAPDPLVMAPFRPGDYIVYAGINVNGEVICYSIVAEGVIITTTGMPPYIRMEDALIGVVDRQTGVEFADTKFIGYVSDTSTKVSVSRIEVDPCTGEETVIGIGSATPIVGRGKFVFRASGTTPGRYTKEYLIRAGDATKETNGGQVIAGQYVQPATEVVLPEFAGGTVPQENDFTNFLYLRDGFAEDGHLWGPLDPWPGSAAPKAAKACPVGSPTNGGGTTAPIVDAGATQQVRAGALVALKAVIINADSFPAGDLSYTWTQTAGPTVTLSTPNATSASFQVPSGKDTTFTFRVTVKSASNSDADPTNSTKTVNIVSAAANPDVVTIDSYTWTTQQGGTLAVTARSNVIDGSVAKMTLTLNNPNPGAALTMTSAGNGKFTYSARSTKQPSAGVTVTSNFNGKASKTTLTAKRRRHVLF